MVRPAGLTMSEPVNTNTHQMEARLDALGREMKSIKLTLSNLLMEQEKFHDQLVAMLTKDAKNTDDGERKIDASENRSESEVRTTVGSKKLEDKLLEAPQQPVQEVVRQKNQETMKEAEQSNVEQSLKMKISVDQSKFSEVTVDSQSPETPASIVLSPKALDRKLGSNGKEIQAACCSVTVSPPPKPPDADLHATEVEVQIAGGPNMIPPPTKPPEPPDVGSPKRYATGK
ncbi:hypothetical protein QL285_042936 [Trifolium repens]|nr:hypothetical protein QL285_042936 [Trifolium repens]